MWTPVTPSVCVCSWRWFESVLCALGIKPYLFTERECLAIPPDFLAPGKQTVCVLFQNSGLLVPESDSGLLAFDLCLRVCLISIMSDNTAEGRKTHLLSKLCFDVKVEENNARRCRALFCVSSPIFLSCVGQSGQTLPKEAQWRFYPEDPDVYLPQRLNGM